LAFAMGWGTYSYFSDTETSTDNVFTAGTIDLLLRNDAIGDWANGVTATWSSSNFAPGEEVTAELRFKNVGTTGAWVVRVGGENLVETDIGDPADPDIADKIVISNIYYSELGVYYGGPGMTAWYEGVFGNGDGVFTLREFVTSSYSMVFWIGDHPPTEYYLPPGGARVEMLKMTFKFMEDAGNEYQGDVVSFDIKVVADQDVSISGKGSGCYGYK
jgi:spore coat-associated protein N